MQPWTIGRREVIGKPTRIRQELLAHTHDLLQRATDTPPAPPTGDGGFDLRLFGKVGGLSGHKVVTAHVGEGRLSGQRVIIPLRWKASTGRYAFPSFDGQLELEDLTSTCVQMTLVGRYVPPLGPVGAVANMLGGQDVARGTAQWLVERLSGAITDRLYEAQPPNATDSRDIDLNAMDSVAMTVRQIMSRDSMVLDAGMPLRSGAALLVHGQISGAPVVDDEGHVIGVLSEGDLLEKAGRPPWFGWRATDAERRSQATTVGEACTRPARTTDADTPVRDAATYMAAADVDRLVVMDGAIHVGIVTRSDVLTVLIRDQEQIEDLVRDIVIDQAVEDVEIDVDNGVVTLRGTLALRSQRRAMRAAVAAIDGIIDVDAKDLLYRDDDLIPPTMPIF